MFVLVTPDILEMDATAQVITRVSFETISIRKKSAIIFARLVFPAYLVLTLSLLRSH